MPTLATGLYAPPGHLGTPRSSWERVLRKDPCSYCPRRPSRRGTIDHIDPRAATGDNTVRNLVGACSACNQAKGPRSLLHFLLDRLEAAEDYW